MNCLNVNEIFKYVSESKINDETIKFYDKVTAHIINCERCAKKVFDAMCTIEALDDWSFIAEKREAEAAELLGVLINLEKAKKTASSIEKNRISLWMKNIAKSSIKLSINIKELMEIVFDEASSVFNHGKYKFGYGVPSYAGAFRGENSNFSKSIVIDKNNPFNAVKILDNGSIEVSLSISEKQEAPMVLLMPKNENAMPLIKIMALDKSDDCWKTIFENVSIGEYSLLIE